MKAANYIYIYVYEFTYECVHTYIIHTFTTHV